jgi:hypothetical protein
MKLVASVLVITLLLGISANTAAYAQIITPQQPTTDIVKPVQTLNSNPNLNNNIQSASIDLNNPIGLGQYSQTNLLVNCPTGVVIYQRSLITNEIVPICMTSDMTNQLFNIDFNVKNNNDNDNNNDDDDNDHDHKKHHKHWSKYDPNYLGAKDPRNDKKYDSIDWQDDDPDKNLSVHEMDKILEKQQKEKEDQAADQSQQDQDTNNNGSDDDEEDTDENTQTESKSGSDSDSNSSNKSDGGESGGNNGGDSGNDGGNSDGESGGEGNN